MRPFRHTDLLLVLALLGAFLLLPRESSPQDAKKPAAESKEFFTQRVAPVLRANCLSCHNSRKTKGGLDLSTRESLFAGGDKGPVIVPGDADKSRLYRM